ncbi:MAG TPA: lipopolysaccharide heptosyltransferase I [Aquella sp.]|nr:lipopolysaccharide heptosyltransferase I [Aquella sp.]
MKKILIIRLSSLGDIIHTFPMVYDIKKNKPEYEIDWLVDENFKDIVKLNPNVNEIISIPLRRWKSNKFAAIFEFFKWKNSLKNRNYDHIIDAQGLVKSAIFTRIFKGTVHGFGKYSIKEKLANKFYNYCYETGKEYLAATKNRLLASQIFGYKIDKEKINFGLNFKSRVNPIVSNYVVFFHATSKKSKKYSKNHWATLADYLIKEYDLSVVLPYGSVDEKLDAIEIKNIAESDKIIVCDRMLNYNEMADLIINAQFIFGVDTGLVHLANALEQKVIAIFTDSDPQKTGIFESNIAKNVGNQGKAPLVSDIIDTFEKIK